MQFSKNRVAFTLAEGARRTGYNATNIGGMLPAFAKGFTLAEILITLGIIGIVAAMTMPTLLANIRAKKNASLLKQDISILSNLMQMARDGGGLGTYSGKVNNMDSMKKWFKDNTQPHIKTLSICYNEPGCWHGLDKGLDGRKGIYTSNKGCGLYSISFVLPNGSVVCFDDYSKSDLQSICGYNSEDNLSLAFYVDVNGDRPPNVYGKDIFILVYDTGNDIFNTAGASKTDAEVEKDCSPTGTGRFCATYAKRNSWKLPPL